jgi:hypothetical protein
MSAGFAGFLPLKTIKNRALKKLCSIKGVTMSLHAAILAVKYGAEIDPFTYEIDFTPATLSTVTTGQFLVQSDAAFAICQTTFTAADTSDALVTGLQPFGSGGDFLTPFLVQLTDAGSGRALTNNPSGIPIESLFGTAQRPREWPTPKILSPNSAFVAQIQNLSATSRNVRLSFHGYKIFGNVANFLANIKIQ